MERIFCTVWHTTQRFLVYLNSKFTRLALIKGYLFTSLFTHTLFSWEKQIKNIYTFFFPKTVYRSLYDSCAICALCEKQCCLMGNLHRLAIFSLLSISRCDYSDWGRYNTAWSHARSVIRSLRTCYRLSPSSHYCWKNEKNTHMHASTNSIFY